MFTAHPPRPRPRARDPLRWMPSVAPQAPSAGSTRWRAGLPVLRRVAFTYGARMIGIRFPVKKIGPITQDTFDRIDIRRPRASPSPRELWRRSRTPGSPDCEPPPRVNEGSRLADGPGACAPRMRSTDLCRPDNYHVDLRLDPSPSHALRRLSEEHQVSRPAARLGGPHPSAAGISAGPEGRVRPTVPRRRSPRPPPAQRRP